MFVCFCLREGVNGCVSISSGPLHLLLHLLLLLLLLRLPLLLLCSHI